MTTPEGATAILFTPAILALLLVSLTACLLLLPAAGFAIEVARYWDLSSGSERQLKLERRTYLISTLLAFVFITQTIALVLFVHTVEGLSGQFAGAMCATGVLNVNPWGWPALFLKIALFFVGAVWLMLNRLDNRGYDYPLTRVKYLLLLAIAPLALGETVVQLRYFLDMERDIITSCCGSLFTPAGEGVAAEISGMTPRVALIFFYASGAVVLASGIRCLFPGFTRSGPARAALWQRCGIRFAASGMLAFVAGLVAIVSVIALYSYEHPHHHCPFCMLEAGHGFVGYWLYIPLFGATALALGVGTTSPWERFESLREAVVADIRRFTLLALLLFGLFHGVAGWVMIHSNLTMTGVWW